MEFVFFSSRSFYLLPERRTLILASVFFSFVHTEWHTRHKTLTQRVHIKLETAHTIFDGMRAQIFGHNFRNLTWTNNTVTHTSHAGAGLFCSLEQHRKHVVACCCYVLSCGSHLPGSNRHTGRWKISNRSNVHFSFPLAFLQKARWCVHSYCFGQSKSLAAAWQILFHPLHSPKNASAFPR